MELIESGTKWLGPIPTHWELSKIGHCFNHRNQIVSDKEFEPLSVTKNGVLPQLETAAKSDNSDGRKLIRKGDFVINQRSDRKGSAGVSDRDGSCSVIYTVLEPTKYDPRYAHHLFRSAAFQEEFYRWGTGIVDDLWSTRYSLMKQIVCPVPPIEEQKAIADFLDKELKLIDALIEKQHLLVASLDELLKAQIHQAITRGTSLPDELQSTDVEWAQSIPAGWTIVKASRLLKARKGARAAMLSAEYCGEHEGEFPVYSGQTENNGVMAKVDSYEFDLPPSSVLFTTTVGSSRVMTVSMVGGKFSLSQNCMIMQNIAPDVLSTDFAYWLLSVAFEYKKRQLAQHMQLSFRMADLYSYKLPLPPLSEQLKIAEYLTGLEATNVRLKTAASNMVRILQERRQALIGAAVTGKIDIRGRTNG